MSNQLLPFSVASYVALVALAGVTGVTYRPGQTAVLPNGNTYEWTGTVWVLVSSGGAAQVTTGSAGQAHDRERVLVASTRSSCTYTGAGITDLEVTIIVEPLSEIAEDATATAAIATLTIAGVAGKSVFLNHAEAGYTTAGQGTLTVSDGVTTMVYAVNTTREIEFTKPFKGATGASVTCTLSAGAALVVGYVSAGWIIRDYADHLAICFSAPSDATADVWLLASDSSVNDSQRKLIMLPDPGGEIKFNKQFTAGITRLDMISTRNCRVVVEGV